MTITEEILDELNELIKKTNKNQELSFYRIHKQYYNYKVDVKKLIEKANNIGYSYLDDKEYFIFSKNINVPIPMMKLDCSIGSSVILYTPIKV